jgi:hypothetical protein
VLGIQPSPAESMRFLGFGMIGITGYLPSGIAEDAIKVIPSAPELARKGQV